MNFKMMGRFLAQIMALEAAFLVPAFGISLYFGESGAGKAFLLSIAVMALLAGVLFLLCRGGDKFFGARDGLVCVSIGWIVLSLLGALPFWLSREIPSFVDAFLRRCPASPPGPRFCRRWSVFPKVCCTGAASPTG